MDYAIGAAILAAAVLAAGHAVVWKREPRSAAMWLLAILLLPAIGPVFYALFGVNRVERRAARMRRRVHRVRTVPRPGEALPGSALVPLARLMERVIERPLVGGNSVDTLVDGSEVFPAMLEAIDGARHSVALASYIFHGNGIGERFVQALVRAHARGVAVRVLIDDVSCRFAWSPASSKLRKAGVPVAIFNPPFVPARLNAMHLRNHRKILVVDGRTGFTGGMNIDRRYWGEGASRDTHFRVRGPIVASLMDVFAEDWEFAAGEVLHGAPWYAPLESHGDALARGIDAGPDWTGERLRWAYVGALNAAQRCVRICTPYFLPDSGLISVLNAAALRGVEVDIVLPERNDLPHIHWASTHQLWQVIVRGCRVWRRPGAFDHSKLMVVDSKYSLIGSGNWDARSLRLNFEFNLEVYCDRLGAHLESLLLARRAESRPVHLVDLDRRAFAVKLRDGAARLFAPLL